MSPPEILALGIAVGALLGASGAAVWIKRPRVRTQTRTVVVTPVYIGGREIARAVAEATRRDDDGTATA